MYFNTEEEVWKDVKGYEGHYQVSNLGNARSLDREVLNQGVVQPIKGRILKAGIRNGYKSVVFSLNGKVKNHSMHRLVAEAFIDNEYNLPVVNHIDENKLNNAVNNLEWCTQRENILKSSKQTCKPREVAQYTLDGALVKIWHSASRASKDTPFDDSLIRKCCTGERNKHKGYKWAYTQVEVAK